MSFRAERGISATRNVEIPPPGQARGRDDTRHRDSGMTLAEQQAARAAAQAWPGVRAMLGDDFRNRFAAYASTTSLPQDGGPLADGRAFVRYLAARMPLSDDVTLHALSFD